MDLLSDRSKIIRAPSLKRGKNDERLCDRIKLKKVLGLTVCSNAALDVSPTTGVLAYPAGCTVVLFNTKKLTQSYLLNTSRKAITAVAYSQCGRYIATGECGINPAIRVWELDQQVSNGNNGITSEGVTGSTNGSSGVKEGNAGGTIVAEFLGHKYAVSCVAFSPTGKYLVSVGSQHDMIVNVFDWKLNLKIASNKVSAKVAAVSFSEDGNYFVTVGNRHVKYWYLEGSRKYKEPIPLMGRSAILGELRNNDFCAVACGRGDTADSTYALTRVGHLVEFNSRRLLDKWVACRTASANCISVSANYILVGCAEAIVRIFNSNTLEYITTLPRTHYLGVEVSQGTHINHIMSVPSAARYPDTIAMVYDEQRSKVTCVYNDHSLYIWDLRDVRRVGKSHSFLYHSACIWGVETVPYNVENTSESAVLPEEAFLTCSSDDTIRVWGMEGCTNNDVYRKNIYSKELLKVVYIDEELNFIKDTDNPIFNNEKSSSYDGRNGVRCIKIDSERTQLATGDRSGNIRIYNLNTLKLLTTIEAHDSEVLCLEYTNEKIDRKLLASASRDRLVHVFDVMQGYKILQTLDDHSSSITSVKFIGSGLNFQMISCGADKSIMFRTFQNNQFLRGTNCSGKTTLYDMEIDSNSKHVLTACQDRNIRVYGTQSAKHTKTFKGSHSDEGSLIKLSLDPSGIYIATSCTDKTLSVYDYYSNECMARMYGHSELVTGLKFTNDCKYLISASGDGCIFIWQIPHDMIVTMQARLSQQRLRSGHAPIPRPISNTVTDILIDSPPPRDNRNSFSTSPNHIFLEDSTITPGYKFSDVGQLPQWAKRKGTDDQPASTVQSTNSTNILSSSPSQSSINAKPRGRWAQRGQDADPLDFRSSSDSPSLTNTFALASNNNNNMQTSDYNSGSSKDIYNQAYLSEDSSIDSGMETKREIIFRNKLAIEQKKGLRFESTTEHDGDVEDISDGERTSSDHGMMFYPTAVAGTPTDFKVNAMNEDELRKSVRRQKFEKSGLTLTAQTGTASAGTGTGTSDTEDEGSTPSGENADRSLASTLGGSSENIPQQASSSFLIAALDGPGSLADRSDRNRRSISAKHNIEIKSSFSKSYTNSKKEELMKVISEVKQTLQNGSRNRRFVDVRKLNIIQEVGYRSNLRGSQSISDLSGNVDIGSTASRLQGSRLPRAGDGNVAAVSKSNTTNKSHPCNTFFNCAAPKSVLTQNCNAIRQISRNYPPYPYDIGVYSNQETSQQSTEIPNHQKISRPTSLVIAEITPPNSANEKNTLKSSGRKHASILKKYKSCPVSPVHEELEWGNMPESKTITFTEPKRHSVYGDDAKTILDMIHIDTEKMIEEITKKYGDLDSFQPSTIIETAEEATEGPQTKILKSNESNEHDFLDQDEQGNFSSDSLEDCSLDLDIQGSETNPFRKNIRSKICKKHHRKTKSTHREDCTKYNSLPKRSVSDYFIYEEFCQPRNVSLSEILIEDGINENQFLETQRHSSASFFLVQYPGQRKSEESILSDDLSGGGAGSYYNSMESILSDESDCKSAPLEVLFNRGRTKEFRIPGNVKEKPEGASKSYGSSPNASGGFDYYMQQRYIEPADNFCHDVSGYSFDSFYDNRLKPQQCQFKKNYNMTNSATFPVLESPLGSISVQNDEIPRLAPRNAQYSSNVNKSLSNEFASHRQLNNSNPLYLSETNDTNLFVRKSISEKPVVPTKPPQLESNFYMMKKSCSFEIEMNDSKRCSSRSATATKRFEKNLEKFENDHRSQPIRSPGGTLEMAYVPHKPPVAARRSSSMRSRIRSRNKERYNTVDQINCSLLESPVCTETRDFVNKEFLSKNKNLHKSDEQSFEIFISEKSSIDDDNLDSLELYHKPKLHKENSVDSLDGPDYQSLRLDEKSMKNSQNEKSCVPKTSSYLTEVEYSKFKDIENKIDVINKLVELEEKKLEQEKIQKELRMRPFNCDVNQKGYVKSLTMNFDKLAKSIEEEIELERKRDAVFSAQMKRNYSLPDVLEGAKFQAFEFLDNNAEIDMKSLDEDRLRGGGDDDLEFEDFDDDPESEKLKVDYFEKDQGIPKSFLSSTSVQIVDDSSIRRACSLSDLSMGKGAKLSVIAPKPTPASRSNVPARQAAKRNSATISTKQVSSAMGTRSISVGVLNQSDSETDTFSSRGGILRPTISSQNRATSSSSSGRNHGSKTGQAAIARRKGLQNSYSSGNLAANNDDSSSEEAPTSSITANGKPAVPPRPRSIAIAEHKKSMILNSPNITKTRGSGNFDLVVNDFTSRDTEVANSDITSQLCSDLINRLNSAANAVLQLHTKLKHCEETSGARNINLLVKELENAVIMTQNMFRPITNNKNDNNPHVSFASSSNSQHLPQENGGAGNDYHLMMNKCTDLLNRVRINHKSSDLGNDS